MVLEDPFEGFPAQTSAENAGLQRRRLRASGHGRGRGADRQVEDDPPFAEDNDAIGERDGLGDVVGDEDGGEAMLAPDAVEQAMHLGAGQRIERPERLVEEKDAGTAHQGAGERDALLLAAGEDRRPIVGALGKADIPKRGERRIAPAAAARDADIADDALPGEEAGFLEEHAHRRMARDDRLAVDGNSSGGRPVEPGNQPEKRRLANARAPDRREELAGRHGEIELGEHAAIAEALRNGIEGDALAFDATLGCRRLGREPDMPAEGIGADGAIFARRSAVASVIGLFLRAHRPDRPGARRALVPRSAASSCRRSCRGARRR